MGVPLWGQRERAVSYGGLCSGGCLPGGLSPLTSAPSPQSVASMTATQVGVCRALTVPPEPLELPLAADPSVTVTIAPPVAHTGPGPIHMRLLSYQLREGQVRGWRGCHAIWGCMGEAAVGWRTCWEGLSAGWARG